MAEIHPVALGFELAIGFGLICQLVVLGLIVLLIVLARRRGSGPLHLISFFAAMMLAPVTAGWVSYHCLQYRDYIRSKADDPVASAKLDRAAASLGPVVMASFGLCFVTFGGGWVVARFGRFPKPNDNRRIGS